MRQDSTTNSRIAVSQIRLNPISSSCSTSLIRFVSLGAREEFKSLDLPTRAVRPLRTCRDNSSIEEPSHRCVFSVASPLFQVAPDRRVGRVFGLLIPSTIKFDQILWSRIVC